MFGRRRKTSDFGAEIEAHIELEAERQRERGLDPDEAYRRACLAFGNPARARERFYESGRALWRDHLWRDVRFAARMLRKSRGYTVIAILTIALGVGATTAIFSVVDATLFRPLPYAHPEQLVSIQADLPGAPARDVGISQPEWLDLQHSGIFAYVSPIWFDENNLVGSSQPTRVSLLIVAPDYFALLGIQPQRGRIFDPANYSPGFTGEVLISDGLWKRQFGADPGILGRSLRLDTDLYRIVGVMPPEFRSPGRTIAEQNSEVWAATSFFGPPMPDQPLRNRHNLPEVVARLQPGISLAAAQARLDALAATLQQQYPNDYPRASGWSLRLVPLKEVVVGKVRRSLLLLLGAVGLVLLIGCVNLANLALARASARTREIAVRQALGATRRRVVAQLLTESALLSLAGGTLALAILFGTKGWLLRLVPANLPRLDAISIDWTVLLFGLAVSLLAGTLFGLAPALHAGHEDPLRGLKQAGRGSRGSASQTRTRRALVVAEFAISLTLMIAACLLLRSFWELLRAPLGFSPESVMSVRTRLPYPNVAKVDQYPGPAQKAKFAREVLRRVGALPRVEEVAAGDSGAIPLDRSQMDLNQLAGLFFFQLESRDSQPDQARLGQRVMVTTNYFHLLRMPLLRGRFFNDSETDTMPQVAVVNEAFARTYWPGEDALGKRFRSNRPGSPWISVVGVVADARTGSLADPDVPLIYSSLYQEGAHHLAIFARGQFEPAALAAEVRREVQAVDPTLPVFGAQELTETVAASLSERRFALQMVALFALTALLMTALGVYGVISYLVSERTQEIGIRLALGASRTSILRMVLRQGAGLAGAGAGAGLAGAAVAVRLMAGLLYGVRPTDPATFAAVALLLMAVALLACYIPARRATRVDPMIALRYE